MQLHLGEVSRAIAPGAHAVVLLDQAGCHTTAKLDVPDNITLLPLPPQAPEPSVAAHRHRVTHPASGAMSRIRRTSTGMRSAA